MVFKTYNKTTIKSGSDRIEIDTCTRVGRLQNDHVLYHGEETFCNSIVLSKGPYKLGCKSLSDNYWNIHDKLSWIVFAFYTFSEN